MNYPTHAEWLASLPAAERAKALSLIEQFRALGATDPEGWARSEISEDIAQLARFVFLRPLWPLLIDHWVEKQGWIHESVRSARSDPEGIFADAGFALDRLLAAGASRADIAAVARKVAYETVFGVINQLDEGGDPLGASNVPGWRLIESGADVEETGRSVEGLHEDLLMLDPSGREGCPPSSK